MANFNAHKPYFRAVMWALQTELLLQFHLRGAFRGEGGGLLWGRHQGRSRDIAVSPFVARTNTDSPRTAGPWSFSWTTPTWSLGAFQDGHEIVLLLYRVCTFANFCKSKAVNDIVLESMRAREPGLQALSNPASSKIKNTRVFFPSLILSQSSDIKYWEKHLPF